MLLWLERPFDGFPFLLRLKKNHNKVDRLFLRAVFGSVLGFLGRCRHDDLFAVVAVLVSVVRFVPVLAVDFN